MPTMLILVGTLDIHYQLEMRGPGVRALAFGLEVLPATSIGVAEGVIQSTAVAQTTEEMGGSGPAPARALDPGAGQRGDTIN